MNEISDVIHADAEMFCGLQILVWATLVVLLVFASFTFGLTVETTESYGNSENINTSTAREDYHIRLTHSQINHSKTLTHSIIKINRKIKKNQFAFSKSSLRLTSQIRRIIRATDESTTRNTASETDFSKMDSNEVKNNNDDHQDWKKRNVKYKSFLVSTDLSTPDFAGSKTSSKNEAKTKLNDVTVPSDKYVRDVRREFGYAPYSNDHLSGLNRLTKRDRSHEPEVNGLRSLRKKSSTRNEASVPESAAHLDVTNAFNNKKKGDRNHTTVKDGLTRHERQTPKIAPSTTNSRNIRAREEGDAIIGALFPLHHEPPQTSAYARQCGEIWEQYGIQRVETFLMTVESINRNPNILPHIKLGWDIRDSCWYSAIALENSIDFIKDAIASQSKLRIPESSVTPTSRRSDGTPTTSSTSPSSLKASTPSPRESDMTQTCTGSKNLKPIIGLVGPGSSESTIQVQNLLQIFNIPQIGYSATSLDLSNKNHYRYFLRVVPTDLFQAQALVDILITCNWTYISTVYTDGNYGLKGMTEFTDLAKAKGICIAVSDNVPSIADDVVFDNLLKNLIDDPNASVVVCFCQGTAVKSLFNAIRRRKMERRLLIIGSDGWGNRLDIVQGVEPVAVGAISMMLHSPTFTEFRPHYERLRPHGSPKNPWFNKFWEWRFSCSLDKKELKGYGKVCSGNESLAGAEEDSKLGFVVNAVTTLALGLHNMHQDLCPGSQKLCPAMEPLNGSVYLQYLLNVSFNSDSDEAVYFDEAGDPPGRYKILNYQPINDANGSATYDYITIGHWTSGNLTLELPKVYWPQGTEDKNGELQGIIKSVCSEPCNWNEAKKVKGMACCWICTTCLENEILVDDNTDCRPCDLGKWPNLNLTDCEEIPVDFIHWRHTQAIVCMTLGSIGICVTMWVFAIFIRSHNTPVVKASTRELSYILLVGISLAFGSNFFIVSKPAKEVCYLTRILPGLSFSLMYGALVTRTNRIARILEGSKRIMTKKPKFMSATAQVVITGIIIGIECAVITAILIYQPADARLDYTTPKKVRLICDTSTLGIVVPLGFDLVLILLCTIYAVKTRNLPENFNEAKFIGFTMYSTCIIWLGFFPIYFAGENKEITLSISVSLSAAIALALLFMPKVYVIVWVPSKNTRGAFTTSKDVRCHIGSKSMNSGDSIDIKESSTYESLFKSDKGQARYWRQKSLDEKRLRFVMQRTTCSEEETPYINHGVIENHTNQKSVSIVDVISKESSKADSRTGGTHNCPDKEKHFSKGSREISGAEIIRQNLARDFPMHRPQVTLRPGSPAEILKHKIHNVNDVADMDELQGLQTLNIHGKAGKPWEIRKSLSSTCVSPFPRTVSVQCQTTDDLVGNALPPLRRRCVSKNKNKLERSEAVEDFTGFVPESRKEVLIFKCPIRNDSKSLPIRRSPGYGYQGDYMRHSPPELSETFPLMASHNCDHEDMFLAPEMTHVESSTFDTSLDAHQHHRICQTIPRPDSQQHPPDISRQCNQDLTRPSPILTFSPVPSPRASSRDVCTPLDFSDHIVIEGVEKTHHVTSPICNVQCNPFFGHLPRNLPEPGASPSNQSTDGSPCSHGKRVSSASPNHHESNSSSSVSIASSSSFTLPPFRSSTDSNPTQQSFDDSYNSLDLEQCFDSAQNNVYGNDQVIEINDIHRTISSQPKGDYILNSKENISEVPVVPLESVDKEKDDVLEFHRYLQVHGVKLELPTLQSSDL